MTLALALEALAEVGVAGGLLRRRLGGVLLAGERRVEVHDDDGLEGDVGRDAGAGSVRGGVGGEVVEQDRQTSGRELAAVVGRDVDAVEADQVGLYSVAVIAE